MRQQPPVGKTWNGTPVGRQAVVVLARCCLGRCTILLRRPTGVTLHHLGSQWDSVSSRQECVHSLSSIDFSLFLSFVLHEKQSPPFPARRIHLLAPKSIADYLISTSRPSWRDSRTLLTLTNRATSALSIGRRRRPAEIRKHLHSCQLFSIKVLVNHKGILVFSFFFITSFPE